MSSIIVPKAQGLMFCRKYAVDPIAHEVSLRGLIHRLRFPLFPTAIIPFTVYAVLEGGMGEGEMKVRICQCAEGGLRVIHEQAHSYHFVGEPNTIECEMILRGLQFLVPGMYLVVLSFDETVIGKGFLPVETLS